MIVKKFHRPDSRSRAGAAFRYANTPKNKQTSLPRAAKPMADRHSYASLPRNPMVTLSDSRRNPQTNQAIKKHGAADDAKADIINRASNIGVGARLAHQKYIRRKVEKYNQERYAKKPTSAQKAQLIKPTASFDTAQKIFKKILPDEEGMLRIVPLGGCEEVGRNMTVFEFIEKGQEKNRDIVIVDMGLQFPEEDMPGIDYIIPNIEYLKGAERNIRAVIFTHGHLDHIGAAPILLEKLGNPPIVGRNLTIEMIKHRTEDYQKGSSKNLKTIYIKDIKDQFKFGNFTAKFFAVEHSIMDAVGVVLETPAGTVIHPGDWTMEADPLGRPLVDYRHLANLKTPTIMMLESLAATRQGGGKKVTEKEMTDNLTKIITDAPGRIIIGTFASQIERIKQIIDIASTFGKKIALDGFSMKMNLEIAQKLGYVKLNKNAMITINEIHKYPDNKILILCTGAQGESNAVMSRIINNNHKYIRMQKNDTIVFSSSIIPGNERTIQRLKDNMYRLSDNVIHSDIMDVHVSGHGNIDDIKTILRQVMPTYFMPVYANHYMLKEAAKVAIRDGFAQENILIPDNGSIMEFPTKGKPKILDKKAPSDYVFVDGLGIGDISHIVLRDRQMMAEDGMIVVIATVSKKTGELLHSPDIISRGFIYMKENKKIIEETRNKVRKILKDSDPKIEAFPDYLKNKIRNDVGQFLFAKTERRPMVLPVVIEV
ncbi:MAG: Beta-lactamase domain protein [Candidatus Kuenenbacteria bacterium GW2011_GWA2_42_15]|uniref:Beta-lactamase domain protein n=4 Tax=Candidatus Kueneniibacteriota TaxID=1752740 RepID=A0A0G0Z128_9BACT|nr:MAG: Beta-lactamase domain protein [Candidatus Kuenenbacteria bacterium GW2011_GWA2_42_15]